MDEIVSTNATSTSPFDSIKRTRADGSEFWSARDLMPLLGYDQWKNFKRCVIDAQHAAEIAGVADQFSAVGKMVQLGSGAEREIEDFELTRYACYMVAMSCDGRKPEVAAAKTYFAVRTREAEVAAETPALPQNYLEALEALVESERDKQREIKAREAAQAYAKELEPKADSYDQFLSADGTYSVGAVAKMLGRSQNKLFDLLRNAGVMIAKGPMRNTPYQQYMHHFAVKAYDYERSDGSRSTSYTTRVQPSGIAFISRKLGIAVSNALPGVIA